MLQLAHSTHVALFSQTAWLPTKVTTQGSSLTNRLV